MSEQTNNNNNKPIAVPNRDAVELKGGGQVTFANEVIAIIAALAASDTAGIAGMSGTAMSGITEMLGRKNLTKGVKVEVGTEEAAVDVYVVVKYGFKIQDVASSIQNNVRNAVETMTGLRVVEVNVYVQGIEMEKEIPMAQPAEPAKPAKPEEVVTPPAPPRVK